MDQNQGAEWGVYDPPFDIQQEIKEKFDPSGSDILPVSQPPSLGATNRGNRQTVEIPGNPILTNQSISEFLNTQLSVEFLNEVNGYLESATQLDHNTPLYRRGWQGQRILRDQSAHVIHPLHRQLEMRREIMVNEDPCLHLMLSHSTIRIKPLPPYLLRWQFFKDNICPDKKLYGYATGFLFTYICLIRYPSDFRIALGHGLIPEQMSWKEWSSLATELAGMREEQINKRWLYGELHLREVNSTFRYRLGLVPYRFFSRDEDKLISRYFRWWVLAFAILSVVLGSL